MLTALTLVAASLAADAPDVKLDGFVLRPEIHYAESSKARAGGLAFLVDEGDARYALMPYQLFGAASGMPAISAEAMPSAVRKVALSEVGSGAWLVNGGSPLRTAMAPVGDSAAKDLVVIPVEKPTGGLSTLSTGNRAAPKPGKLASVEAKKGDAVWLVTPVGGATTTLHRATVAEVNGDFLFYDMADASLELAGTAGAPVVNATGEVVGMQVGVIRFEDGVLAGSAAPLSAIRARIGEASATK